ncbi:MAG TPA: hypothetical protein ENK67_04810 [Flavobacteriia bacterium]|nr:hypothetical protein [Flavobacteriia bacterium]
MKKGVKMQTIKVNTNNHTLFNTIMDFLKNLPQNEFKVEVENRPIQKAKKRKLNAISLKTKGFKFDRDEAHER